jgi:hypothetical protein
VQTEGATLGFRQGRNLTGRRIIAFIIDVLVANCIALSIPWTVAEMTQGRYRLTEVTGLSFKYCALDTSESDFTAGFTEQARRALPFNTYLRTERCVTRLNLILRNPFIQVVFSAPQGQQFYAASLDFNGNKSEITTLNQYAWCFKILFFVFMLVTAWLDSPGVRLLRIRIRTLNGEKLNYAEFGIQYIIIGVAFAPLLLIAMNAWLSIGLMFVLGMILLFPWFKRDSQFRRGLHDVLAGTTAIRAGQVT